MSRVTVALTAALVLGGCTNAELKPREQSSKQPSRPNILLIVADDLGYSDIGVFGGEIRTPNLDALAADGIQFTNFHAAMSCSPSRSMMLTGVDSHRVGLGNTAEVMDLMAPEYRGYPGYEGYLNFEAPTLPQLLRDAGYRTYMTGKWHLGYEPETSPSARGFDRTFALLDGAAGHFDSRQLVPGTGRENVWFRENGQRTDIPEDFYSSRFYARKLIEMLESDRDSEEPFFAYLAFTAPHWPLQAPEASIARYAGAYDEGYETLFAQRLQRQKELGLIDDEAQGPPPVPGAKPWAALSPDEQKRSARLMEIYAAMVSDMDTYIGEVLQALKALDQYDNTVILFMSDNGAEGGQHTRNPIFRPFIESCCDNSYENLGKANSFELYGPMWARVSSAPSRYFKSNPTQGGLLTPAIARYPRMEPVGRRYEAFVSVLDIMPTFLELAEADERSLEGKSLVSVLEGAVGPRHGPDHVVGWEMLNRRAVRKGDWKLVLNPPPLGDGQWKLYNTANDPSELIDQSQKSPQVFERLLQDWENYVETNGVVLPEDLARR